MGKSKIFEIRKLKIITDEKNRTTIYINGKKARGITGVKFEHSSEGHPSLHLDIDIFKTKIY